MKRGRILAAVLIASALGAGCATTPDVAVRAVGVSATAGGDQLALGRAALALGNVGLALQYFRQSLRTTPESTEALAGIAQCYDAMGRNDLSRRYYQEALALAPADTRLLRLYADALGRQGALDEAKAVISEIALRTRAPAAQWVIEPAGPVSAAPAAPPATASVVVTLAPTPLPRPPETPTLRVAAAKVRLERLSLGEIALVTSTAPLWRPVRAAAVAAVRTDRVAVGDPAPRPLRLVRLLNAARRQGLAGRSAAQLKDAGWRRLAVGNASRVRAASLILYPAGRGGEARALASHLRITSLRAAARSDILVLLGRDSA